MGIYRGIAEVILGGTLSRIFGGITKINFKGAHVEILVKFSKVFSKNMGTFSKTRKETLEEILDEIIEQFSIEF